MQYITQVQHTDLNESRPKQQTQFDSNITFELGYNTSTDTPMWKIIILRTLTTRQVSFFTGHSCILILDFKNIISLSKILS